MSFLLDIYNQVNQFINEDIYIWGQETVEYFAAKYVIFAMEGKIAFMKFAFGVAQEVMEQLSFDDLIHAAWDSLPAEYFAFFSYLKIPESLNLVISAFMTRFVMDFFE